MTKGLVLAAVMGLLLGLLLSKLFPELEWWAVSLLAGIPAGTGSFVFAKWRGWE